MSEECLRDAKRYLRRLLPKTRLVNTKQIASREGKNGYVVKTGRPKDSPPSPRFYLFTRYYLPTVCPVSEPARLYEEKAGTVRAAYGRPVSDSRGMNKVFVCYMSLYLLIN